MLLSRRDNIKNAMCLQPERGVTTCGDDSLELRLWDLLYAISTAQHGTAQHSMAQHGTAQHSTARHSTAQHSTAQHSTAQHSTAQHSTAQQKVRCSRHLDSALGMKLQAKSCSITVLCIQGAWAVASSQWFKSDQKNCAT